jgi:uncharacterized protein involved in type VI secretion and phage assembly
VAERRRIPKIAAICRFEAPHCQLAMTNWAAQSVVGKQRDGEMVLSGQGVSVAVVTDNNDPDKLGRVKIRFRTQKRQRDVWARVAVPMAGRERGTYFLPEINDEVLVAFENADPAHPYVIGALWNRRDPPPEANADGRNDRRLIRSRKGHQLMFDDGEDGALDLRLNDGRRIRLDDQAVTIDDGRGNSINIQSASGTLKIRSTRAIAVSSPEIAIEGSSIELKAAGRLVLRGALVEIN